MSMTENAANISLSNQALGLLGSEDIVLNGSTQNHTYCTTFFDDARDEILVAHKWNFAKKRAYAIQTTDPLFGYDNAFTPPSDNLKILQIEQDPAAEFEIENALIITDEGATPSDWATATAYLAGEYVSNSDVTYLCIVAHTSGTTADEPGAGATTATYWTSSGGDYDTLEVEYIYQVTDLDSWPIYARRCFVLNLAVVLCSPIKQAEALAGDLQAMLYGSSKQIGYLNTARSLDAQEGGAIQIKTQTWIDARD